MRSGFARFGETDTIRRIGVVRAFDATGPIVGERQGGLTAMRQRVARLGLFVLLGGLGVGLVRGRAADEAPSSPRPSLGEIRDGYESSRTRWRREHTDATIELLAHERSEAAAREGRRSERIHFNAGIGSGFHYSYALPRIPISRSLLVGLQLRSNKTGLTLLARVVLPGDVDPDTGMPSFVLVQGGMLEDSDRWRHLELADLPDEVERQARVIRASSKRKVSLEGAYLDRLVLNLYGGPGETEVFIDDLVITPVPKGLAESFASSLSEKETPSGAVEPNGVAPRTVADRSTRPSTEVDPDAEPSGPAIRIDRNRLTRKGAPWVFTGVSGEGVDPERIRRAGFDILGIPATSDETTIRAALAHGLLLMPSLSPRTDAGRYDSTLAVDLIRRFKATDSVAFWSLGDRLGGQVEEKARDDERDRAREVAQALRKGLGGGSRLSTASVVGHLPDYANVPRNLDLVGVEPDSWGTAMQPLDLLKYLEQRRNLTALANPDMLVHAWFDATPPPVFREAVWGTDKVSPGELPRVQPDQVRQSVYAALAAGCRGLGFTADGDLTKGTGQALLLEMSLLNEEIDLFERVLGDPSSAIRTFPTFQADPKQEARPRDDRPTKPETETAPHPSIRATGFGTKDRRGTVLLINDYAEDSQFQPPQLAIRDLCVDVPAPADAQGYEISPGHVNVLDRKRIPGGIRFTIPEFGGTSIVYVTTDSARVWELEQSIARVRPAAVDIAIEEARLVYEWVAETYQKLSDDGRTVKEAEELFYTSRESIKSAQDARDRVDYALAWAEARRALRPLRLIARVGWEDARNAWTGTLSDVNLPSRPIAPSSLTTPAPRISTPVCCAPLTSYATLPQFWVWIDWVRRGKLGPNLLPSGDFEGSESMKSSGWVDQGYQSSDLAGALSLVETGVNGKSALKLSVAPRAGLKADELPPFVDHPVAAIRTPPIKVRKAEMVRVAVYVKTPRATVPGAGGLIVRDSLGGEPLQFRSSAAIPDWREVVIYRRAPRDGDFSVVLGYAGFGEAFFDHLRVQKIEGLE